ncbi:hypothetical protein ACFXPT_35435 [Streptomyces goshikiensis]|uniref:hypothetical protein n=1 Tax=Streptomyces goshikiensis TaxID=1942 RepID=UPI00369BCF82
MALAIQYGHMRTAMRGGHASRGRGGIHELRGLGASEREVLGGGHDVVPGQAAFGGRAGLGISGSGVNKERACRWGV